jgi:hypothetical protein
VLFFRRRQSVAEAKTLVRFSATTADVSLTISTPTRTTSSVALEILDPEGTVKASSDSKVTLNAGAREYKFAILTNGFVENVRSKLPWYRLRYRVGTASGTLSMSEIMRDDFELRAYVAQRPYPGEEFIIRVRLFRR